MWDLQNEKYRNNTKTGGGENHSSTFQDLPSVLSDQPKLISRKSGSRPRWLVSWSSQVILRTESAISQPQRGHDKGQKRQGWLLEWGLWSLWDPRCDCVGFPEFTPNRRKQFILAAWYLLRPVWHTTDSVLQALGGFWWRNFFIFLKIALINDIIYVSVVQHCNSTSVYTIMCSSPKV